MQNFIFCQIFSVLFHPVSFPVLLLPAVPAFSPPDRFPFFPVFRRYSAFFFSCRLFFPSPFFRPFPLPPVFLISVFPTPRSFFLPFPSTRFCTLLSDAFSPPAPFRPNITSLNISRNIPMLRFAAQSVVRGRL